MGVRSEVGIVVDILGFRDEWSEQFDLFNVLVYELDNEPFYNKIFLTNPIDGNTYLIGSNMTIRADYSGDTPDEIRFIIDGNNVYTDNSEPFEYVWDTSDISADTHTVSVSGWLDGSEINHDDATISFQTSNWTNIDLSDLGLNASTNCNTVFFFTGSTAGWMTVDGPGLGKVLYTSNGGVTWQEKHSTNKGLFKVKMFNTGGEGIFLDAFNKVQYTSDNGVSMSEMSYDPHGQPSFQWNKVFDFTTNANDQVVAVAKDQGIPYQYQILRANIDDHTPAGAFLLPYPNEYGSPPSIIMKDNKGVLYNVFDEDNTTKSYYMYTTDGGASWLGLDFNIISSTTRLNGAFMGGGDRVWIASEEDGHAIVLSSTNAGQTWSKTVLNDISGFESIQFLSNSEGYATIGENTADASPKLYHTLDGGASWDAVIEISTTYGMSNVTFTGPELGFLAGKGATAYRYTVD